MSERPSIGVGAVAISEGRILLIRRAKAPYQGRWTLPGGTLGFGETIDDGLRREVLEETGLTVEVGDLAGVVEAVDPSGEFHFVILDYHVEVSGGSLRPGDDASEARWVFLQELEDIETTPRLVRSLKQFGVL